MKQERETIEQRKTQFDHQLERRDLVVHCDFSNERTGSSNHLTIRCRCQWQQNELTIFRKILVKDKTTNVLAIHNLWRFVRSIKTLFSFVSVSLVFFPFFANFMSKTNKRFFDDDPFRQTYIPSTKKRPCPSSVPSVPRGGTDYIHKFRLSADLQSFSNNIRLYSTFDAGDRLVKN